jgi:hypothetical protein
VTESESNTKYGVTADNSGDDFRERRKYQESEGDSEGVAVCFRHEKFMGMSSGGKTVESVDW